MKVVAQFQFYFAFVIPRSDDWPSTFMRISYPDLGMAVMLRAKAPDEELFPHDIDQTLSLMTWSLSPVSQPVGSLTVVVRDRCLDRMEALVEGEVDSLGDVASSSVQQTFESVAIRATNSLLEHCRVLAKAPFTSGVERHYRPQDGAYYTVNPSTISWFRADTREGVPAYQGEVNATSRSGAIRAPVRGQVPIRSLTDSMSEGEFPRLELSLLVDAEEHLVLLRLRESILALASACEIASNAYVNRLEGGNDETVQALLRKQGASFAEKRFHEIPSHLSRKSLKTEDLSTFELVEELYRERNDIIHGKGDPRRELLLGLDAAGLVARLDASRVAIRWLDSL